ncbi:MAG: hypothetical protein U9Q80_10325 [Bacillota bacterium]|nr:hypothetical protein [Bacillota bacterium]
MIKITAPTFGGAFFFMPGIYVKMMMSHLLESEDGILTFLYSLTMIMLIISFLSDSQKTKKALKIGAKKLWKITPPFVSIIVVISIVLYLVPNEMIVDYLGAAKSYFAIFTALTIGAITVMPGPIVYPLCGILIDSGVSYSVIAAFSSSLMMVGILSFPVESAYFGKRFAVMRNIASLFVAFFVSLVFAAIGGGLL